MRAIFAPQARRDLSDAVDWIARDISQAAEALIDAVQDAAQRIGTFPEAGLVRPDISPAPRRFLALTGFPYVIVYNSARTPPLILRILHGARDLPSALDEA